MKNYKITFYDAWDGTTQETFIFAQSALDAEMIFIHEEDSFVQVIDVQEEEECQHYYGSYQLLLLLLQYILRRLEMINKLKDFLKRMLKLGGIMTA